MRLNAPPSAKLEELADAGRSDAEYLAAELNWADAYGAVQTAAAELGVVYYEEDL